MKTTVVCKSFIKTSGSVNIGSRARLRHIQEVVHHFWKRWLREWLPFLSPRKKWGKEKPDLGVGDLVLILSTDTTRGKWPLGRIVQVFPGPDGHVCTADVKVLLAWH